MARVDLLDANGAHRGADNHQLFLYLSISDHCHAHLAEAAIQMEKLGNKLTKIRDVEFFAVILWAGLASKWTSTLSNESAQSTQQCIRTENRLRSGGLSHMLPLVVPAIPTRFECDK